MPGTIVTYLDRDQYSLLTLITKLYVKSNTFVIGMLEFREIPTGIMIPRTE